MRAIRTTTISILALGLLAGSAVGVAAQDESDEALAPALMSGKLTEGWEVLSGDSALVDGAVRESGVVTTEVRKMSDPRLTGTLTIDFTKQFFDVRRDTDLHWGTVLIENDEGAWEGMITGTSDLEADGAPVAYYELVGSGAYDGLSAIVFETGNETPIDWLWSGIIFPGDLPPDR